MTWERINRIYEGTKIKHVDYSPVYRKACMDYVETFECLDEEVFENDEIPLELLEIIVDYVVEPLHRRVESYDLPPLPMIPMIIN